jgi:hypothetical protein
MAYFATGSTNGAVQIVRIAASSSGHHFFSCQVVESR